MGAVGGTGTVAYDSGSDNYTMVASGTDIWDTADEFTFVYKTLSGDGTMVARVDSVSNSNVWAKGGVMIRQNIQPGSVHAFMPITPGGSSADGGLKNNNGACGTS